MSKIDSIWIEDKDHSPSGWMMWGCAQVHYASQGGTQFKNHELFALFLQLSIECGAQLA